MDVVTVFLYGALDETIYMRELLGFTKKGTEDLVCRLLKSLYGLKQAPRQWNKRFDDFMQAQGFQRSMFDPCVYLKHVSNEVFGFIILVLYVDDMLIAAKERSEVDKLKALLNFEFQMKDLGTAKRILGMQIHRDLETGKLWLTQDKYARKILARYVQYGELQASSTLLAPHFKISSTFYPI